MDRKNMINVGLGLGILISGIFLGRNFLGKVEHPTYRIRGALEPEILYFEDRNGDGLKDLIKQYAPDWEIEFYARRNSKGKMEYSIDNKHNHLWEK